MSEFDWHTGTPDKDGMYLCKVEGMKYTNYSVMQWRYRFWWRYYVDYTGTLGVEGWFDVGDIVIKEWTLIEELKD